MAKKKGKKGKGKKKAKAVEDPNVLNEVDKTFYELQITDLNRKLARLRTLTTELEDKNLELEEQYRKLDEDRADVIAYLKRSLQEKQNELVELQERLTALQEAQESSANEFDQKIEEMENEYKIMREQLTSEIKLITGKLNALEEFRLQRDELMEKYREQETAIEEQEIRHKRVLYETEKKFILGKDALKREMEKRILDLATDYQKTNDLRIAATTHRTIRENIALNNELDKIIASLFRLEEENAELKGGNKNLRLNNSLFLEERNNALSESQIQNGVIKLLNHEHKKMTTTLEYNKTEIQRYKEKERELVDSQKRENNLKYKICVLEQNLHASHCREQSLNIDHENATAQTNKVSLILNEAVMSIKAAMKMQNINVTRAEQAAKREALLANLLKLLTQSKEKVSTAASVATVDSCTAMYKRGDLGFIPRSSHRKAQVMQYHQVSQVGRSFEDFIKYQPSITETSSSSRTLLRLSSDDDEESELPSEETEEDDEVPQVLGSVKSDEEEEIGSRQSKDSKGSLKKKELKAVGEHEGEYEMDYEYAEFMSEYEHEEEQYEDEPLESPD